MRLSLSLLLLLFSICIQAEPFEIKFDNTGTVSAFDPRERTVEIDYQQYKLPEDASIIGATRRGEYGDELKPGQNVGFNVTVDNEGKPVIEDIMVIKNVLQ